MIIYIRYQCYVSWTELSSILIWWRDIACLCTGQIQYLKSWTSYMKLWYMHCLLMHVRWTTPNALRITGNNSWSVWKWSMVITIIYLHTIALTPDFHLACPSNMNDYLIRTPSINNFNIISYLGLQLNSHGVWWKHQYVLVRKKLIYLQISQLITYPVVSSIATRGHQRVISNWAWVTYHLYCYCQVFISATYKRSNENCWKYLNNVRRCKILLSSEEGWSWTFVTWPQICLYVMI